MHDGAKVTRQNGPLSRPCSLGTANVGVYNAARAPPPQAGFLVASEEIPLAHLGTVGTVGAKSLAEGPIDWPLPPGTN